MARLLPQSVIVTFATPEFEEARTGLVRSALEYGEVADAISWTRDRLMGTAFYRENAAILGAARGAGYWAWKPYVILEALRTLDEGEFAFYSDVGRGDGYRVRRSLAPLLAWTASTGQGALPGVVVPGFGRSAQWTKRDCFVYMHCDEPRFWNHPQVQATYSVWQKSAPVLALLEQWLACCCDARLITDAPNVSGLDNLPSFRDHRHDQSILTNLVVRAGWPRFHLSSVTRQLVRMLTAGGLEFEKHVDYAGLVAEGVPRSVAFARFCWDRTAGHGRFTPPKA